MGLTLTPNPSGGGVRPVRMMGNEDVKMVFYRVTWDSSYASGGESLAAADVGLNEILYVFATNAPCGDIGGDGLSAIGAAYDYTNSKLLAIQLDTGKELTNGTNISAFKTRLLIIGQ